MTYRYQAVNQWQPGSFTIEFVYLFQVTGFDPVLEVYTELRKDLAPVAIFSCPFFRDVHRSQIQKLEKGIIGRKDRSCLGDFPQLPVKVLNLVRRIDHPAQFLRILEVSRYLLPVVSPAGHRGRVFPTPVLLQKIQALFSLLQCGSLIYAFQVLHE